MEEEVKVSPFRCLRSAFHRSPCRVQAPGWRPLHLHPLQHHRQQHLVVVVPVLVAETTVKTASECRCSLGGLECFGCWMDCLLAGRLTPMAACLRAWLRERDACERLTALFTPMVVALFLKLMMRRDGTWRKKAQQSNTNATTTSTQTDKRGNRATFISCCCLAASDSEPSFSLVLSPSLGFPRPTLRPALVPLHCP